MGMLYCELKKTDALVFALIAVYYIKLQRPLVCLCVSVPLLFRHDRRTATKFGTHIRVDTGLFSAKKNLTHPTPGGFQKQKRRSEEDYVSWPSMT